jgi:hypothetical protein
MNFRYVLKRLVLTIILVVIAMVLASLYGYFHNKVTFSISYEYFTEFKFDQFSALEYIVQNDDPLKASYIGILATWWFVAIIGGVMGVFSFFLTRVKFVHFLKAILICIGVTILFSFLGYLTGKYSTEDLGFEAVFLNGLQNKQDFLTVGTIHNYSYFGGIMGLVMSVIYLVLIDKENGMKLWHPRRPK